MTPAVSQLGLWATEPAPSETVPVLTLTPNRRGARCLADRFDQSQLARRRRAWKAAEVHAWDDWLEEQWEAHASLWGDSLPASPELEEMLWQDAIRADEVLVPRLTAGLAAEAHALEHAYKLPRLPAAALTEEQAAFVRWQSRYEQGLADLGLCDRRGRERALLQAWQSGQLPRPQCPRLVGFTHLTPFQKDVLSSWGDNYQQEPGPRLSRDAWKLTARTESEELAQAVAWLTALWKQKSTRRLALVVPDLEARRSEVERLLLRAVGESNFNLSLGQPLGSWPLAHCAGRVLRLLHRSASFSDLSSVLRSPFLGEPGDRPGRGRCEANWRRCGLAQGRLSDFLGALREHDRNLPFVHKLQRLEQLRRSWPKTAAPAFWAEQFALALQCLDWPGPRAQSSAEHQTAERVLECLSRLPALTPLRPVMTASQASEQVEGWLQSRSFQPRGRRPASIQVLGLLEAAGLEFDAVWVTGLTDAALPAPGSANPFLPRELQRRAGVPHCSPEQELAFGRELLHQLTESAPRVVFSCAERHGDEELRPSRLLLAAAGRPDDWAEPLPSPAELQRVEAPAPEEWFDEHGPSLPEEEIARGGTRIFKLQAACAFRAFGELRLGAQALESTRRGLSAAERGHWNHRALELAWEQLEDSAALARANLSELAHQVARRVVLEMAQKRPDLGPRYLTLEGNRLSLMCRRVLELERTRELPFRVLHREKQLQVEIAGLRLNTIVDRVDLVDGRWHVLLDYKSGDVSTDSWFGERPDEPQLPLYAVAWEEGVDGLAFLSLKASRLRFLGHCSDPRAFPRALPGDDGERLKAEWRLVLERLAQEFRSGYAAVQPKESKTCQFCALGGLCRVGQRT